MRVSRTQAEENRQTVINVASRLFREHGFDGIGLKDLMEGAGLTQGAFYKQFASKDDLSAQAASRALEIALNRWKAAAEDNPQDPLGEVIAFYLSMEHRAEKEGRLPGCGARLRCCEARRRAEGVIRSRDQRTARNARLLDWRHPSRGVQRQGNGDSLDDGRCGGPLASSQRRAAVEAASASGRQVGDGVGCRRRPIRAIPIR